MVSDGASYGNLGVDRSEVTAFQRWDYARPEFNLEVAVFPHGYIKNLGDGLRSIVKNHGFVGTRDWAAERSVPLILSIDPWKRVRADTPEGYYPDAEGRTRFGAGRLRLTFVAPGGHGRIIDSIVDLSYVSWHFENRVDDFSTHIVARIIPGSTTAAGVAHITGKTSRLLKGIQNWPERTPLDELRSALRRDLNAKLAERAEEDCVSAKTDDDATSASTLTRDDPPLELVTVTVRFPKNRK
jgi:hypothetical protein